ncbi:MAG: PEP-CTERM sorting domain-containing protein [Tepidisphaeraceae bacterium]
MAGIFKGTFVNAALAAGLLSIAAATANAAVVNPGLEVGASAEVGPTGGTVVATSSQPVAALTFTGTLTSSVISGDTSNPFNGSGGLTFVYQFTNTDTDATPTSVTRLTVSEFTTFITDMSFVFNASLTAPTLADRSASGDVIGFSFLNPPAGQGKVDPGDTTTLLVVQTTATSFAPSIASIINGTTAQVPSFAPAAVPEPATAGLLGAGAVALLRRRRRVR